MDSAVDQDPQPIETAAPSPAQAPATYAVAGLGSAPLPAGDSTAQQLPGANDAGESSPVPSFQAPLS